jgi:hypothetical protein
MRILSSLAALFFIIPIFQGADAIGSDTGRAAATVDYGTVTGTLSRHLAGITEGPFFSEDSYSLVRDGGFSLAQVTIWLSGPDQAGPGPAPGGRMQDRFRPQERAGDLGGPRLNMNIETAKNQIRSLFRAGAQPLILMTLHSKPADMSKFQELVKSIVAELRTAAREEGKDLLLFRFGNEPDSKRFWTGTREEYFETYRAWANTVKAISPNFIVEAPAVASATKRSLNDEYYETTNDFTKEFLRYCRSNQVPVDIFTFHYYGTSIVNLQKEISAVSKELRAYQGLSPVFGQPKIGIDEWNIQVFGLEGKRYQHIFDTAHTAAHNVAALITMARNDVWLSVRFGGLNFRKNRGGGEPRFGEGTERGGNGPVTDFLMVARDGSPKPVFYGFKAFNALGTTPQLVRVVEEKGVLSLAGKSPDGRSMNIVVSLYDADLAREASQGDRTDLVRNGAGLGEIRVRNLPWGVIKNGGTVEIYTADDSRNLALADRKSMSEMKSGEDLVIRLQKVVPSVSLIQLKW